MMTKKYFSSKEELIGSEYNNIKEIAFNILRSNTDLHFLDDLVQEICLILLKDPFTYFFITQVNYLSIFQEFGH